ncbi:hypothetical protein [Pseudomonas sp. PDM13]|uniref:DUF7684 family protein n=1 Tax=Pseudomonas sp. PDM13 TaxID=2769255 RepID=UPI0021DFACEE|nr:hypothetical protein [Pseudomonas sp. PDM13]MCU9947241.1 hypothetical protein [Pseudomonas sp. PDM13]
MNGRTLLVVDVESLGEKLEAGWTPYVVLITAWSRVSAEDGGLSILVNMLLEKGAKNFVCVGYYSEVLHDEIDEILYECCECSHVEEALKITTTYHDDEPVDDVVSYFIYGTSIPDARSGGLLAIVGEGDWEVRDCLSKHVVKGC